MAALGAGARAVIALLIAVPAVAAGQGTSLTFSGTVLDIDGRPAAGITVHLIPVMDDHQGYTLRLVRGIWADPVATVKTDAGGRWALAATPAARP